MGNKLLVGITIVFFLLHTGPANTASAQPRAMASFQPERIEAGDTTGLLIFVSGTNVAPKDVDFSAWAAMLPAKNILARGNWRRSGTQWTRRFTLIAFDSAALNLPPLKVQISAGNTLETNELKLTVVPTPGGRELSDMAGIREIRKEPVHWTDYWPWAAGALLLIIIGVLWWKKKVKKPQALAAPIPVMDTPPVSPVEQALQQLSQLEQKAYWKSGQVKTHYAELSLILREFMEKSLQIAALESTTAEIQRILPKTSFPAENRAALIELLQKADWVKYAQSQPPEADHAKALEIARRLVAPPVLSRPTPPPPTRSGGKKYEPL
jgi:hypothetical protein